MVAQVVMPQVGITTTEAKIIQWLKKVGEKVTKGEPLFEVETDKATMEVEAPADGFLVRIDVGDGATAEVGRVVALIADSPDADISSVSPASKVEKALAGQGEGTKAEKEPDAKVGEKEPAKAGRDKFRITPLARRIAKEAGLSNEELANIKGSGAGGIINKADVLSYLEGKKAAQPPAEARRPASAQAPRPVAKEEGDQVVELTRMRRAIAQRMCQSVLEAPQFWLGVNVKVDRLLEFRDRVNQLLPKEERITVTDMIVRACALALRAYPQVNATFTEEGILLKGRVNVGIAVAIDEGLIVPVVKDADKKALREIAAARRELVKRAREGVLSADELTGGTFTVSNLGMLGIDEFKAILNPPEAGILAVGQTQSALALIDGRVEEYKFVALRLTLDHRVVDGALGARFLSEVRRLLEEPYLLV
ncbi:dihydrolipoamide acetyltransferase family protein [Thermanaeromonas sp. C210]|uniref:dihydrolipoamide acetyltransferase family protein n=1 Tax=Thermanaeromonas sp. C210 TaxID=2731925 RepID=UPI00155D58AF|nr:dihydrolipoamide acetyltransferase family protein [Thermanaeromonas sp. C210]GFN24172.1 acetyltransferase component of pyruvate dehydrogenase complex [Thermanaeromonas sp. C210]